MRMLLLVRHGLSEYNTLGLMNGDPTVSVGLTPEGRRQCERVGGELAGERLDLAVHTRFDRTVQSLAIILAGREVPEEVYPELDDVRMGVFEGRPVAEYRAWRHSCGPEVPPPGEGESRIDALARYVDGFQRLLDEPADTILAVVHDVPIRFLSNAMLDADPLNGPVTRVENATVLRVDDDQLYRGVGVMRDRLGQ